MSADVITSTNASRQPWMNPRSCKMVSVALAAIVVATGAIILAGAGNMAGVGMTISGWTCVGLGLVTLNISLCIYCIKKHSLCAKKPLETSTHHEQGFIDSTTPTSNHSSLSSTTGFSPAASQTNTPTTDLPTPSASTTTTAVAVARTSQGDAKEASSQPITTSTTIEQEAAPNWALEIYNICTDNIQNALSAIVYLETSIINNPQLNQQAIATPVFNKNTSEKHIQDRYESLPQKVTNQQFVCFLKEILHYILDQKNTLLHAHNPPQSKVIDSALGSLYQETAGIRRAIALIAYASGDMDSYQYYMIEQENIDNVLEYYRLSISSGYLQDRDPMYIALAQNALINDISYVPYLLNKITDPTKREVNCLKFAKEIYTKHIKARSLNTAFSSPDQACLDQVSAQEQENAIYKACGLLMQAKEGAYFWLSRISPTQARDAVYIERVQAALQVNKECDAEFWLHWVSSDKERDAAYIEFVQNALINDISSVPYWLSKIIDPTTKEENCLKFAKEIYTKHTRACSPQTPSSNAVQGCLDQVRSEEQRNAAYKECGLLMQAKEGAYFWLSRISPPQARDAVYIERAKTVLQTNNKYKESDAEFWLAKVSSTSARDSSYTELATKEFNDNQKPQAYHWLQQITDEEKKERLCLAFAEQESNTETKKWIKTWILPIQNPATRNTYLELYAKKYHKEKNLPDVALGLINAITDPGIKQQVQQELQEFDARKSSV